MGADPVAICKDCRKIITTFNLSDCVNCINDYFDTDIDQYWGRLLDYKNLFNRPTSYTGCLKDECEGINEIIKCLKNKHEIIVDPCW